MGDGSDQISDLWISGVTVKAPEVQRASTPHFLITDLLVLVMEIQNSFNFGGDFGARGGRTARGSVCCRGSGGQPRAVSPICPSMVFSSAQREYRNCVL